MTFGDFCKSQSITLGAFNKLRHRDRGGSAEILHMITGGGRSKYYGIMGRVGDKYDEFLSSSILMIFLLLLLTFSQHPVSAYRI